MDSYQSLKIGEQLSIFKDCYSGLRTRTRAFWVKASSYSELMRFINFLRFGEVGQAISRGVRKPVWLETVGRLSFLEDITINVDDKYPILTRIGCCVWQCSTHAGK